MSRTPHIPPGRERLWRRQAEADAEVRRAEAAYDQATCRGDALAMSDASAAQIDAADEESERLHAEWCRAEAVAERVHEERTAGLSSWIDHDPTAPICGTCHGTGGPRGCDARGACKACRGWGREYREAIPVWSDRDKALINPATGRAVDLLADPQPAPKPAPTPPRPSAAPTNGSAGGNVASIEEVRAGIAAANEKATEALGALNQAHADLEQAQGMLMRATEGSGQADVSQANGMLAQAVADVEELRQKVSAAISSAEDVGNRL